MKPFKITILGASSSGKTCYMLAMYKIMSEGKAGFSLNTCQENSTITDKGRHSDLVKKWKIITKDKQWIETTNEAVNYHFALKYGGDALIKFDFLDYRGETLEETEDQDAYNNLLNNLLNSHSVICCVSGEYWKEQHDEEYYSEVDPEIGSMNILLGELKKKCKIYGKSTPPVTILITKYDECQDIDSKELQKLVRSKLSVLFAEDSNWLVSIMKTTLGMNLAKNNQDLGKVKIRPKWVAEPIMFNIYFIFTQLEKLYQQEKKYHYKQEKQYKGGFFSSIKEWWYSEEIAAHDREWYKANDKVKLIKKYAPKIKEEFIPNETAYFYYNGEKMILAEFVELLSGNQISNTI